MYRTTEERLQALEKQIARQDFQIHLLQNLAAIIKNTAYTNTLFRLI